MEPDEKESENVMGYTVQIDEKIKLLEAKVAKFRSALLSLGFSEADLDV